MRIYIVSPSSKLPEPNIVEIAVARFQQLGFEVELDPAVKAEDMRFAGTDEQRLSAFARAAHSDADIVMPSRGGYGLSRILHRIDWPLLAQHPKTYVGYSDFTAFNLALYAKAGQGSFSGVVGVTDFGTDEYTEENAQSFKRMMYGEKNIEFPTTAADLETEGLMWGGNLSMVASLVGTPYMPKMDQGILFIEEVGEHPYRVERMLTQLFHSGILARQKAIILGEFTGYKLAPNDNGYNLDTAINWLKQQSGVPVVSGLPFGHGEHRITVPNCQRVRLSVRSGQAHITIL